MLPHATDHKTVVSLYGSNITSFSSSAWGCYIGRLWLIVSPVHRPTSSVVAFAPGWSAVALPPLEGADRLDVQSAACPSIRVLHPNPWCLEEKPSTWTLCLSTLPTPEIQLRALCVNWGTVIPPPIATQTCHHRSDNAHNSIGHLYK